MSRFRTSCLRQFLPLHRAMYKATPDGQLKWIIENGIFPSGMPASRGIPNDEEMWQLVLYIRHLPPAGSLGEPRAYSGDEYGDVGAPQK